jgi:hypothetical protein
MSFPHPLGTEELSYLSGRLLGANMLLTTLLALIQGYLFIYLFIYLFVRSFIPPPIYLYIRFL